MLTELYYTIFRNKIFNWDPVLGDYQTRYANKDRLKNVSTQTFELLEEHLGSLDGKKVLDIGGGAGNYSFKFLEYGSEVAWTDISQNMMKIAQDNYIHLNMKNSKLEFYNINPNYIEKIKGDFDLIFLRLTWLYTFNDKKFAIKILKKLKSNGFVYILTNNVSFKNEEHTFFDKLKIFLYLKMGIKIGHPHPPIGKLKTLFPGAQLKYYKINESTEELLFQKLI